MRLTQLWGFGEERYMQGRDMQKVVFKRERYVNVFCVSYGGRIREDTVPL